MEYRYNIIFIYLVDGVGVKAECEMSFTETQDENILPVILANLPQDLAYLALVCICAKDEDGEIEWFFIGEDF